MSDVCTNLSTRVNGDISVVFNDRITEKEVDLIYVFLKKKFNNFFADSIECGRHSVNVTMNYVTDEPYFDLAAFFDQIKALDPNKINAVISRDGLTATEEE